METFNYVLFIINYVIIALFMVALGLQIIYILLFFLPAKKYPKAEEKKRFGIIICARNEADVIGATLETIFKQNYPRELFDVFVVADNCTDNTAEIARQKGATVFERFDDDTSHRRVSYALKYGFENILKDYDNYDAFIRFDADNFPHPDYITKMNDAVCSGVKLARGYNNSKNITQNIISSISGLWYIRDSRFNGQTRSALRLGQLMSGPGMTISAEIIRKNGGWIDMGFCEDADFSLRELNEGTKAEYVKDAIVYEDQPVSLKDTFRRNMRMGRGLNTTFRKHGLRALGKFFTTFKFTYLDMFITELFVPLACVACLWFPAYYIYDFVYKLLTDYAAAMLVLDMLWKILVFAYAIPFIAQALLVCILDRKRIKAPFYKLLPGIILFPLFMIFYALGITLGVLFKPKWKATKRSAVTAEQFTKEFLGENNLSGDIAINMSYMEKYGLWREKVTDGKISEQLSAMENDEKAKENAFYKDLEFGTGGLRGEIGAGTNCLNVYTIAKVTQGVADCMKSHGYKTAAIAYDSRINSDLFARRAAEVFASNGIKTYITRELMPTPFLSFLTREKKADIGVMITASHNPAKYNGYKVYGSDGCQLTDAAANEMTGFIEKVNPFEVITDAFENYSANGIIETVDDGVEEKYLSCVESRSLMRADGIKIAYTPLNGTGYRLVPEMLKRVGVAEIFPVPPQDKPDGNFTTCTYPNPEKAEALELGLCVAKECGADLLIATDPDADRMGIAVKNGDDYALMTGNEVGVLLTDFLFSVRKENGTLPEKPVLVKTIVSTALAEKVAAKYDAEVFDVLTGFKYIGDVIAKLEKRGEEDRFVLGYEESYGYLSGTYVRDKDAVVASMLTAEMAAYYKKQGKTLVDRIREIYAEYGTYEHKLVSKEYPGAEGNARMKELLANLRENLPDTLSGSKVVKTVDYLTQTEFDLPKSNVLLFRAQDGTQLIVRPSGTEPLIKFYLTACKTPEENKVILQNLQELINTLFA